MLYRIYLSMAPVWGLVPLQLLLGAWRLLPDGRTVGPTPEEGTQLAWEHKDDHE